MIAGPVSLCRDHHAEQHAISERAFEQRYRLDLLALAEEFARRSPHGRQLQDLAAAENA
jgi:hypothetical protein